MVPARAEDSGGCERVQGAPANRDTETRLEGIEERQIGRGAKEGRDRVVKGEAEEWRGRQGVNGEKENCYCTVFLTQV